MKSFRFTKQMGIVALAGAVAGIAISVLLNAADSKMMGDAGARVPFWQPGLEQAARPLLTFASSEEVYPFYGRLALPVFAALAAGLYGLYARQRGRYTGNPHRLLTWGYRLALAGFILNILGNLADYWLPHNDFLDNLGFVGGTILGLLVLAVGQIFLGAHGLRSGWIPRLAAWALILWLPLLVVLFLIGMGNLPAAPLLALCLVWIVVSVFMIRAEGYL